MTVVKVGLVAGWVVMVVTVDWVVTVVMAETGVA